MSRIYDSWEKLVGVVLRREKDRQLAYCESITTSSSADFSSRLSFDSDVPTDNDSSTTTADRFRRPIVMWQKGECLGRGSLGTVYEGIADDGFFFSIKEVSLLDQGDEGKQHIAQLRQEITFLSKFEHDNIVQYLGSELDESHLNIFLDLVTKGSLLNHYRKYPLRDLTVSPYTRQILHGLKYLHGKNVVHRNIKCANILLDLNGLVKLADFGLAKATEFLNSYTSSLFWMAPEVVNSRGHGNGIAADIWSLGCTVLEMFTRSFPYSNLSADAALDKIKRGERPDIPASISSNARDFILECLQVDPSLRPTAAELLQHPFVKLPPFPLASHQPRALLLCCRAVNEPSYSNTTRSSIRKKLARMWLDSFTSRARAR